MDFNMSLIVSSLRKLLRAVVTLEWLFLEVNMLVYMQGVLPGKPFVTLLTMKGLFSLMTTINMFGEMSLC